MSGSQRVRVPDVRGAGYHQPCPSTSVACWSSTEAMLPLGLGKRDCEVDARLLVPRAVDESDRGGVGAVAAVGAADLGAANHELVDVRRVAERGAPPATPVVGVERAAAAWGAGEALPAAGQRSRRGVWYPGSVCIVRTPCAARAARHLDRKGGSERPASTSTFAWLRRIRVSGGRGRLAVVLARRLANGAGARVARSSICCDARRSACGCRRLPRPTPASDVRAWGGLGHVDHRQRQHCPLVGAVATPRSRCRRCGRSLATRSYGIGRIDGARKVDVLRALAGSGP